MDALLRFLNRPVIIRRAHPTRRMRAVLWCLLALFSVLQVADLVTTWALVGAHQHPGQPGHPGAYHEGDPVAAWALAHGGVGALAFQKMLAVAVVLALAPPGFRLLPRTALVILTLLCSAVAGAAIWNTHLLILR